MLDAATAEAIALQSGLNFIEDMGCAPVIIETDSLELMQDFNGVIEIWSPYAAILSDCFQRARRIGNVTVQHCYREANDVAHKLARVTYDSNNSVNWDGVPPSFLLADVINDVSVI